MPKTNSNKNSIKMEKIHWKPSKSFVPEKTSKIKETSHSWTQKFIAVATAIAFFTLLGLPLIFGILKIIEIADAVELMKTIAAILSGIVGMVWGFYFHKPE